MRLGLWYLVLLLAALQAACDAERTTPVEEIALRRYAPNIRLGERVGSEARRNYNLAVAPYVGYADTSYRGSDGLGRLYIMLDRPPGDGQGETPPRWARVESVGLSAKTPAAAVAAESQLRLMFGAPQEICYAGASVGRKLRALFWPGRDRGVLLVMPHGPRVHEAHDASGVQTQTEPALLTIGAEAPQRILSPEPCS